ncbi:hypothetical protein GMLC_34960 [Geomonas limicola]|uniref:Response regulatory domain-containing protein n=1 Tax=Geomonas limicola TaxID=2740186 RepID=A0A6V8NDP7_9BACT|nr:response regulator [Geomonas limicola]GFO69917.1 hypothetical protein GMLC_34960 [Geomonas limicola]
MRKDPILFVDDDILYLRLVESIVRQRGITAYYATSGEEALEVLRVHPCDAMVTDLNMPGMNGYLLGEQAKMLLPNLHIVMVTSEASHQVCRQAALSGIAQVLEKPASVKQVQAVLQAAAPWLLTVEAFPVPDTNAAVAGLSYAL